MNFRRGLASRDVIPRRRSGGDHRGMVTVELAIGFVTATFLTATLVAVVLLGVAQAACARTSTEMARQLTRGDAEAAAVAQSQAPAGAEFDVDRSQEGVKVRVSAPVSILGMGDIVVVAQRWAAWEPGVSSAPPG